MNDAPSVTVIVPARNEARHIEACVHSILDQSIEGSLELLVVDGRSDDSTAELARRAGAHVLDNPARTTPAALNRGLDAARGDVVIRFDAHGVMSDGYIAACLRALEEERAANVGGWIAVAPEGPWGRALAVALRSRLGVGNSRLWRPPKADAQREDVDTISFGCFRTEDLRAAGGWADEFHANQDFELNYRLRRAGGRVVFDPAISSIYRPRESLAAIARQYLRYGRWKAVLLAREPSSLRPRQLAPPALLATAVAAALPSRWSPFARALLAGYGLALGAESARARAGWRVPVVLTTMHLLWGAGLCSGFVRPPLRDVDESPADRARHHGRSRAPA